MSLAMGILCVNPPKPTLNPGITIIYRNTTQYCLVKQSLYRKDHVFACVSVRLEAFSEPVRDDKSIQFIGLDQAMWQQRKHTETAHGWHTHAHTHTLCGQEKAVTMPKDCHEGSL